MTSAEECHPGMREKTWEEREDVNMNRPVSGPAGGALDREGHNGAHSSVKRSAYEPPRLMQTSRASPPRARYLQESAFASAISAAGVAHSVARACSQGRLLECGCEPSRHRATAATVAAAAAAAVAATSAASQATIGRQGHQHQQVATRNTWKWGGCSHNLEFGLHFSTNFLDAREKNNGDIHSRIVLHNNEAGRQPVTICCMWLIHVNRTTRDPIDPEYITPEGNRWSQPAEYTSVKFI
ncbi:hypothetical protein AAG570_000989 [Ranatra chinensis]|uniref:Protein Wnt n=1 Tax=Ranatra chinensis TaxID=642074 RepID=A0ABD0YAI1_9HEMI